MNPPILRSSNLLYPPFAVAMADGIAKANAAGHPAKLFETFRSATRQRQLYEQGRTARGPIVTNAGPMGSWHQYGVAADIAMFEDGVWHWNYDPRKLSSFFDPNFLTWGGPKDGPHYQWAKLPKISMAQAIVSEAGHLHFWSYLEKSVL